MKNLINIRQILITLAILFFAGSPLKAQFSTPNNQTSPGFDFSIVNGQLSLDGLTNFAAVGALFPNKRAVPAIMDNLVSILRLLNTNVNYALEPRVKSIQLGDLKYHSEPNSRFSIMDIAQALSVASGNQFGVLQTGGGLLEFGSFGGQSLMKSESDIDVINLNSHFLLSGIITSEAKEKQIDEVKLLIHSTLEAILKHDPTGDEEPQILFHPDTGLVIILGNSRARDVAHKILTALNQTPFQTNEPAK